MVKKEKEKSQGTTKVEKNILLQHTCLQFTHNLTL